LPSPKGAAQTKTNKQKISDYQAIWEKGSNLFFDESDDSA
jgi:hypothetical protein